MPSTATAPSRVTRLSPMPRRCRACRSPGSRSRFIRSITICIANWQNASRPRSRPAKICSRPTMPATFCAMADYARTATFCNSTSRSATALSNIGASSTIMSEHGWSRAQCAPHAGHLLAFNVVAGLGLGCAETAIDEDGLFGKLTSAVPVADGRATLSERAGNGVGNVTGFLRDFLGRAAIAGVAHMRPRTLCRTGSNDLATSRKMAKTGTEGMNQIVGDPKGVDLPISAGRHPRTGPAGSCSPARLFRSGDLRARAEPHLRPALDLCRA